MKLKQVFSNYDWHAKAVDELNKYCPLCGNDCVLAEYDGKMRRICCKCKYIHYRNPLPGVTILIEDNEKILLCRRRGDMYFGAEKWCLPGGYIEYDEDFLTAAIREVQEETGLKIKINSIINVTSNFLRPYLHTLVIVLHSIVVGGELAPGDDIDQLMWINPCAELPTMAFAADKHIIRRYFSEKYCGVPINDSSANKDFEN